MLSKLNAYKYNYRNEEFTDKNFPAGNQIGLMGQEVEQVAPELTMKDEKGFLHVNYQGLVPLLVKGINELETRLEQNEKEIQELKALLKK
jgi:hypothetical protein